MSDLEYLKQFREIREIADIIHDIDGLDSLVSQNDWTSVDRRLRELSDKFLIGHGMEKVAEMALKHREKNQDVY